MESKKSIQSVAKRLRVDHTIRNWYQNHSRRYIFSLMMFYNKVSIYSIFLHIMMSANHLCEDAKAVMELVRAPGPHVGHRAGHLGGEEAAHYGGHGGYGGY